MDPDRSRLERFIGPPTPCRWILKAVHNMLLNERETALRRMIEIERELKVLDERESSEREQDYYKKLLADIDASHIF